MCEDISTTIGVTNHLNGRDFTQVRGKGWRGVGKVRAKYVDFSRDRIRVTVEIEVYTSSINKEELSGRISRFINHWIEGYFCDHPTERMNAHPSVELTIKKV